MSMRRRRPSGTGRYQDDTTIPDTGGRRSDSDDDADRMVGGYQDFTGADEAGFPVDDSDDEMYDEIGDGDEDVYGEDPGGLGSPRR